MPSGGAPSPEQWAQWMNAPEDAGDVLRIMFADERLRGFTFGGVGTLLAVPLGVAHWILDKIPDEVLPPPFVPGIVAMIGVFLGVYMAVFPFMDVSHGIQVAMQGLSIYGAVHGVQVWNQKRNGAGPIPGGRK